MGSSLAFRRLAAACVGFIWFSSAAQAGLIAYYPLDGNADDVGPNNLDGVVFDAVPAEDRFGNPNGAMQFDGIDDYIELPASPLFVPHIGPGGWIRISAWVKVLALDTDSHVQPRQPVVSLGYGTNWSYALYAYDNESFGGQNPQSWGSSIWQNSGTGHSEITGPANGLKLNEWTFVEMEYKYKEYNRLWVNGVLVAEQTSGFLGEPGFLTTLGPWIGARRDGQYLNAVIDDVRFYGSPEPATGVALALGAGLLLYRFRRQRGSSDVAN